MSLEDRLDKLTVAIERLIETEKARIAQVDQLMTTQDVASKAAAAGASEWVPVLRATAATVDSVHGPGALVSDVPPASRPRGRPRKGTPVEPVNTAPPADDEPMIVIDPLAVATSDGAIDPDITADYEDESQPVEPETVAPAVVAAPPRSVTVQELKDKVYEVKDKVGVVAAQACVKVTGFAKLAELGEHGTAEQRLAAYDAAVEALAKAEEL